MGVKMKKIIITAIVVCLAVLGYFSMSEYANETKMYAVAIEGEEFTVDTVNQVIMTQDDVCYEYECYKNRIVIKYPNGAEYRTNFHEYGNDSGYTKGYDEEQYVAGDILVDVLAKERGKANRFKEWAPKILVSVLCIGIGLGALIRPDIAWFFQYGWKFKNAEPSDDSLIGMRFGGVISIIAGLVILFIW